jgi:hypothetical protein
MFELRMDDLMTQTTLGTQDTLILITSTYINYANITIITISCITRIYLGKQYSITVT